MKGKLDRGLCGLVCVLVLLCCVSDVALAGSDGRVQEMVSPVYKGGYGVGGLGGAISAVAPDGESVAFYSKGVFAEAPSGPTSVDYVAHRGASGWLTSPLMPPALLLPTTAAHDVSLSLSSTLVLGKPGPNREAATQAGTESEFWLHDVSLPDTTSNWEQVGMPLKTRDGEPIAAAYDGASLDWCRLLIDTQNQALLAEDHGESIALYEVDRGCGGEPPSLNLVGVKNNLGPNGEPEAIAPSCITVPGTESDKKSRFNAISADGKEVFFTTGVVEKGGSCGEERQLFVRLEGERTLEISKPVAESGTCGEVIPCPGAAVRASSSFEGASEDGSRVFFTTAAPLVAGDTDTSSDLYMATIGCPPGEEGCIAAEREVTSLVQVSQDRNPGEAGEVQGVVRVSPDGSRVYFVARGLLSEGENEEGQAPVRGADNLYVYDSLSESTTFIADLCSGIGHSGSVADLHCPEDSTAWRRSKE